MNNILEKVKLKLITKNELEFLNYLEQNVISRLKILEDLDSSTLKGVAIKTKISTIEKELDEFLFYYRFDIGKLLDAEINSSCYNLMPIANRYLNSKLKDKLTSFELGRIEKYIEVNKEKPVEASSKQYVFARIKSLNDLSE